MEGPQDSIGPDVPVRGISVRVRSVLWISRGNLRKPAPDSPAGASLLAIGTSDDGPVTDICRRGASPTMRIQNLSAMNSVHVVHQTRECAPFGAPLRLPVDLRRTHNNEMNRHRSRISQPVKTSALFLVTKILLVLKLLLDNGLCIGDYVIGGRTRRGSWRIPECAA